MTGYQRKQLDIYFENPDYEVDKDKPEYTILSIDFTLFEGLFLSKDPIKVFKNL